MVPDGALVVLSAPESSSLYIDLNILALQTASLISLAALVDNSEYVTAPISIAASSIALSAIICVRTFGILTIASASGLVS